MLPDYLVSSLSRFKYDIDEFTTWLTQTALSSGYTKSFPEVPLVQEEMDRNMKRRMKRERKMKKKNKDAIPQRYMVSISELYIMTKHIVNCKKTNIVVTHPHILCVAQRALSTRKRFAMWYNKQASGGVDDTCFITALEQILQMLCSWPGLKEMHIVKPTKNVFDDLLNPDDIEEQFPLLELQDSAIDLGNYEMSSRCKGQKMLPMDIFELVLDDFEYTSGDSYLAIFEAYCVYEDLQSIRRFIQGLWRSYRKGKLDLMTASVVTTAAYEFVRQMTDDFADLSLLGSTWFEISEKVFDISCKNRGIDPAHCNIPEDEFNPIADKIAEWCFIQMYCHLDDFCKALDPTNFPVVRIVEAEDDDYVDTNQPHDARREKESEDRGILIDALRHIAVLTSCGAEFPVEDEFIRGVKEMIRTGEISMTLAFCSQSLIDIIRILGEDSSRGYQELRLTGFQAKKSLCDFLELSKDIPTPASWPKEGDKCLAQAKGLIETWIVQDNLLVLEKGFASEKGAEPTDRDFPNEADSNKFWNRNPLLCGNLMFTVNLQMQEIGVTVANSWKASLYLAHLYNAVQQASHTPFNWPDMETIIRFHKSERVFCGPRPDDIMESFRTLSYAMGLCIEASFPPSLDDDRRLDSQPPNHFHTHSHIHGHGHGHNHGHCPGHSQRQIMNMNLNLSLIPLTSKRLARGLKIGSTVTTIFRQRFSYGGTTNLNANIVDRLLEELANPGLTTTRSDSRPNEPFLKRQWMSFRSLSVLQLLTALRMRVSREEEELMFNNLGVHHRCMDILRKINGELHERLVHTSGPNYIDNESELPIIVFSILRTAARRAESAEHRGVAPENAKKSPMFMRTASILKEYLKTTGDISCKEVRVMCNKKRTATEIADHGDEAKAPPASLYNNTIKELKYLVERRKSVTRIM